MKANVNQEICIGCGLCVTMAGEVFRMNGGDKSECYGEVAPENKDAVQNVIDSCPVQAIEWL